MSTLQSLYTCNEVQVDENGNYIREFEKNLPHSRMIKDYLCKAWNADADEFMLDLMNREFNGRVESCRMHPSTGHNGKTAVAVSIVFKPGVRLYAKDREAVWDFMSAQFCDGWGEGIFGPVNILQAPDGTRFYIE